MNDTPSLKIIITGSGLAGSCLANGLLRAKIDVRIYERLTEDTKREGYQIRLGAAALKGMRCCLSPEHLSSIVQKFGRASGLKAQAPVLFGQHFEELLNLTKFSSYGKSAPINRVVLRDALAKPLSDAGVLKYGMEFSHYEILKPDTTQEHVRVWFNDGSYDDCDILVAADGAHSKINKQVGLDNIRQTEGYTSILSKSELPTNLFLQLPPSLALNPILTFADKKAMYFCAYLPEKLGKVGIYDESLSSAFFATHIPDGNVPPDMPRLAQERQWQIVSQIYRRWAPEYHTIIGLVKNSPMYIYKGRYSIEPARKWRSKVKSQLQPELGHPRIWLIGDAMHPMLPNRGMGGNTALCDTATVLPLFERLLRLTKPQMSVGRHDIEQALKEYEDEMMPRAFAWVKKSGGGSVVPIDTSKLTGMVFIRLASVILTLVGWWFSFVALFRSDNYVDEAPELK